MTAPRSQVSCPGDNLVDVEAAGLSGSVELALSEAFVGEAVVEDAVAWDVVAAVGAAVAMVTITSGVLTVSVPLMVLFMPGMVTTAATRSSCMLSEELMDDDTVAAVAPVGMLMVARTFTEPAVITTSTSLLLTEAPAFVATVSLIVFSSEVFKVAFAAIAT